MATLRDWLRSHFGWTDDQHLGEMRSAAYCYFVQGKHEIAKVFLDVLFLITEPKPIDYVLLGVVLYEVGQYEEALHKFDQALDLNGEDERCMLYRLECLLILGRVEEQAISDASVLIASPSEGIRNYAKALVRSYDLPISLPLEISQGKSAGPTEEETPTGDSPQTENGTIL